MSADLQARVEAMPFWYHRIELPGGVITPGWAPLVADQYNIPADMKGLRVLDVGAWDGYWTFEALKRGAAEVCAIDDFSDNLGDLQSVPRVKWATFDLCASAFGYRTDRVQRVEMSVYDVTPERLGMFDIVFFFGTLYHLRHPLLALDLLSAVCRGSIHIETAICDHYSPYRGGLGHGYSDNHMVMEFYPDTQLGANASNWWAPTLTTLGNMVRIAGFRNVRAWKFSEDPKRPSECRGFARGVK